MPHGYTDSEWRKLNVGSVSEVKGALRKMRGEADETFGVGLPNRKKVVVKTEVVKKVKQVKKVTKKSKRK